MTFHYHSLVFEKVGKGPKETRDFWGFPQNQLELPRPVRPEWPRIRAGGIDISNNVVLKGIPGQTEGGPG